MGCTKFVVLNQKMIDSLSYDTHVCKNVVQKCCVENLKPYFIIGSMLKFNCCQVAYHVRCDCCGGRKNVVWCL